MIAEHFPDAAAGFFGNSRSRRRGQDFIGKNGIAARVRCFDGTGRLSRTETAQRRIRGFRRILPEKRNPEFTEISRIGKREKMKLFAMADGFFLFRR